jgi:Hypothetical glycosyl hydrolase family 15
MRSAMSMTMSTHRPSRFVGFLLLGWLVPACSDAVDAPVTVVPADDSGTASDAYVKPVDAAVVPTTDAGDAATVSVDRFPRLGAYAIGGPQTAVTSDAYRAWAAKQNVLVMTQWPGWQGGMTMTMADVMKDIKARSKVGTKIVVYVNTGEIDKGAAKGGATQFEYQNIAQNHWFLYQNGANQTNPVDSTWQAGQFAQINYTTFAPKVNGKNWYEWYSDYEIGFVRDGAKIASLANAVNPYVDGFFTDNFFWVERVDGDWNLDGKVDKATDPTVIGWTQNSRKAYIEYLRQQWPNSIQLGNVADWFVSKTVYKQPIGVYDQVLDGGVMESLMGESWSLETWGGFAAMMDGYKIMIDAMRGPKLAIFGHDNLAPTDYKTMRYGLTATLMGDGYYYPNGPNGYSPADLLWFDEFDQDLGTSVQPMQTAAWSKGVWRRDFSNGIALCNPKGNGTQTVSLGGTFHKFSGKQAPSVNDGSTVTSVTLAERDGIVLFR